MIWFYKTKTNNHLGLKLMKSNIQIPKIMGPKSQPNQPIAIGLLSQTPATSKESFVTLVQLLVLVLAAMFFSFQTKAQEYQFKVLANQGDNTLVTSDGSRNEQLKVGSVLQEGDKIILGEGAYVGLMHPNGRTMELQKAGEFEISDLAENAGKGNSVASKYADFIMKKMAKGEADLDQDHRQYLKVTGAVERAIESSAIKLMMPNSAEIFNSQAFLKWSDIGAEGYVVTVKNMYDEVLTSVETTESFVKLDLSEGKLAKEKLVIVKVAAKNDASLASEEYGIKRIAAPKASTVKSDLSALKSSLDEENALDKLIVASFFEEHNLLVDALASYEEAITIHPTVKEYKIAYEQFITRHNLLN